MYLETKLINPHEDIEVDWVSRPVFDYRTEVDVLTTLRELGEQLTGLRTHVAHTMRYIGEALRQGAEFRDDQGERVATQAMINEVGLARRSVYRMLAGTGRHD